MTTRICWPLTALLSLLAFSCGSTVETPALPDDHPASPHAASAPFVPPADPFVTTPTYPLSSGPPASEPAADAAPAHGGHADADHDR